MNYNPFILTALQRKTLSLPMRHLLKNQRLKGKCIDYGTGVGFDCVCLKEQGLDIVGYDKFNPVLNNKQLLEFKYDTLTCLYVFNVIPSLKEHEELLQQLKKLSDNIFIAVRADKKAIKDTWLQDEDSLGYWTTSGSFQRFYDEEMVDKLFGKVKYIVNNSSLKLFKLTGGHNG